MNRYLPIAFLSTALLVFATPAYAAEFAVTGNTVLNDVIATFVYSAIGILVAFFSYKVIDLLTPGNLSADIANNNIALAILAGLTNLGICIIIAAAVAS